MLLADDHALVRAGLRALLERLPELEIIGEAADGQDALRLVERMQPDILFINVSMPGLNGLETVTRIAGFQSRTKVIVVSLHADCEYARRALAVGARGYLLKSDDAVDLAAATRAVARGDVWLSPSVSRGLVDAMVRGEPSGDPFELLTSRQREVLQLVAEGLSNKEIATRLDVSTKTIESHRAQLMRRLGVTGTAPLVRAAMRLGLVPPESR